jgi:hypothetical protein
MMRWCATALSEAEAEHDKVVAPWCGSKSCQQAQPIAAATEIEVLQSCSPSVPHTLAQKQAVVPQPPVDGKIPSMSRIASLEGT